MSIDLILTIAAGIIVPLMVWWNKNSTDRIKTLETGLSREKRDFNDFRVKVAETYTTKSEIHDLENKILSRLDHLEKKLDRVLRINGSAE